MTFVRVILYHLLYLLNIKNILTIILICLVNTCVSYYTYNLFDINLLEALVKLFYLPLNIKIDTLRWILLIVIPLIGIGTFLNHQLYENSFYILISMKNYYFLLVKQHNNKFIYLYFVYIYNKFFFFRHYIIFYEPNQYNEDSIYLNDHYHLKLLFHEFILITLSIFLLILLFILLTFLTKNQSVASLLLIITALTSIFVVLLNTNLIKWIPITFSLIGLRELQNFSFSWSYGYLILSILTMYIINLVLFKFKKEIIFNKNF